MKRLVLKNKIDMGIPMSVVESCTPVSRRKGCHLRNSMFDSRVGTCDFRKVPGALAGDRRVGTCDFIKVPGALTGDRRCASEA